MVQRKSPGDVPDMGAKTSGSLGNPDENQTSFIDRIEASATGLIQDSWARPGASAVTESLTALREMDSKAGSSNSATRGSGLAVAESLGVDRSQAGSFHRHGLSESFRSQHLNDGASYQDKFEQWSMCRPNEELQNSSTDYDVVDASGAWPGTQNGRARANPIVEDRHVPQHETLEIPDGAAVVSLLCSPTSVDDIPPSVWDYDPPIQASQAVQDDQQSIGNVVNCTTPAETQMDFSRTKHSAVLQRSIDFEKSGLSLIPDFHPLSTSSIHHNLNARQQNEVQAGLSHAKEGDIRPWLHILDRYHDEVWGSLLPLVRTARDELGAEKGRETPEDQGINGGAAVRRLQMVLQHLNHRQA